jgi:hypothetical protein
MVNHTEPPTEATVDTPTTSKPKHGPVPFARSGYRPLRTTVHPPVNSGTRNSTARGTVPAVRHSARCAGEAWAVRATLTRGPTQAPPPPVVTMIVSASARRVNYPIRLKIAVLKQAADRASRVIDGPATRTTSNRAKTLTLALDGLSGPSPSDGTARNALLNLHPWTGRPLGEQLLGS